MATLAASWPGAGELFADVWSEIALAFLERYPNPAAAASLGEGPMAAFLRKHGYSGRRSPAELGERLRSAPVGLPDGPESEARRDAVLALVRVVRALNDSIKDLDRSVVAHLDEHPDERTDRAHTFKWCSPAPHSRQSDTRPRSHEQHMCGWGS
jgi:hypothetical protein